MLVWWYICSEDEDFSRSGNSLGERQKHTGARCIHHMTLDGTSIYKNRFQQQVTVRSHLEGRQSL